MVKVSSKKKQLSIEVVSIRKAASLYRALYHPLRMQMLEHIHKSGKVIVTTIIKKLRLEQAVVSQQLRILREAKILTTERQGRNIYYSINYDQINRIISVATRLTPPSIFPTQTETKRIVFTDKEIAIIQFICNQKQNDEIAKKLKLSRRTVEGYREEIMRKMKVKNTAGLVIYAIKNDIYQISKKIFSR